MLIDVGEEYVLSTNIVDGEYICTMTFPISKKDFQLLASLDNVSFVVDNDQKGEDK